MNIAKTITLLCITISIIAVCAHADYNNPPLWETSLNFTHQSWDFEGEGYTTPQGPPLPLAPDGTPVWQNLYGNPEMTQVEYDVPPEYEHLIPSGLVAWRNSFEADSSDHTGYYGGMAHTHMTLHIPAANATAEYDNLIWIQMEYYARMDGEPTYDIQVARDDQFVDVAGIVLVSETVEELDDPIGNLSRWYRSTRVYRLLDNPTGVYVKLSAFRVPPVPEHEMGGACIIDHVDIDTKTVLKTDVDGSDTIDLSDMALLCTDWLSTSADTPSDINRDGTVDIDDMIALALDWLTTTSVPISQ